MSDSTSDKQPVMQRPRRRTPDRTKKDAAVEDSISRRTDLLASEDQGERRQKQKLDRASDDLPTPKEPTAQFKHGAALYGTRVSGEDAQKRKQWMEKRQSLTFSRTRGSVLHEVNLTDELHGLYAVCFSPVGDVLACGFGNGTIQVRFSETGTVKHTVRAGSLSSGSLPIMWCRFNKKRTDWFYAASACGTIFACSASSGDFTRLLKEHNNEVNALDVDSEGIRLVTGGRDAKVRVYDLTNEKLVHVYQHTATAASVPINQRGVHSERIFAVRFHPLQTQVFLTGGWDNSVKMWDLRDKKKCMNTIFGPHICGDALDIKNDTVLTGAWTYDNSLQTWDIRKCALLQTLVPTNRTQTRHGEFLYAVKYFDGDPYGDMILAGGSGLQNVEVISINENRVLGSWPTGYPVHGIDSHGNFISYGGDKSSITICDFV